MSSEAKPKKGGKKKAAPAAAAKEEERVPLPPFKPAKLTHYDRQVVDYVRTATAKNIWYYRCAGGRAWGAGHAAMGAMAACSGGGRRSGRRAGTPAAAAAAPPPSACILASAWCQTAWAGGPAQRLTAVAPAAPAGWPQGPHEHAARALQPAGAARGVDAGRHRRQHASVGPGALLRPLLQLRGGGRRRCCAARQAGRQPCHPCSCAHAHAPPPVRPPPFMPPLLPPALRPACQHPPAAASPPHSPCAAGPGGLAAHQERAHAGAADPHRGG